MKFIVKDGRHLYDRLLLQICSASVFLPNYYEGNFLPLYLPLSLPPSLSLSLHLCLSLSLFAVLKPLSTNDDYC